MRFQEGIDAQPEVLAHSAKEVSNALQNVALPGGRAVLGLVGIGASEHAARSAAVAWRQAGLRAFPLSASEPLRGSATLADTYVALSESGRSAETVQAMREARGRRLGVTNVAESPLAAVVDELLLMESGPDSPVYTTGYTATLQTLGLLGERWSGQCNDWSFVPELASGVLQAAPSTIEAVADGFDGARIIDVVGSGVSHATVGEGALLLRESARAHTAAHETYNFLHGPMEPLDQRTACIIVGDGREVRLAGDVSELGCHTLLLTARTDVPRTDRLTVLTLPAVDMPMARPVLEILPMQLLGACLATRRGLAVSGFRYHQDDTKLD
jgi:fructoselysine-6-P-deglycase FrlB-like protein